MKPKRVCLTFLMLMLVLSSTSLIIPIAQAQPPDEPPTEPPERASNRTSNHSYGASNAMDVGNNRCCCGGCSHHLDSIP